MAVAQRSLVEWKTVSVRNAGEECQIAYSARADRVWLLSAADRSITVLDGTSGDVLGHITTTSAPQTCAFDDTTGLAYVPLIEDELAILDVNSGTVVSTVTLPPGSQTRAVMPVFDRQRLYLLNYQPPGSGLRGNIGVLDTSSNTLVKSIPAGYGPFHGKTGHALGKLYIANRAAERAFGNGEITVVDDSSEEVVARIEVGRGPERIAHWPERREMYTANLGDNTVSAIDISSDTVVATIPVGAAPYRLGAVQSINGRDELWVLNGGSWQLPRIPPQSQGGQICVISGTEHCVVRVIQVCDYPAYWAVNKGYCYIPSAYDRELSIVDIRAGAVVGSVQLNHAALRPRNEGMVWSKRGLVFLCNRDDTMSVFESA